jgi:hypothetical protein
MVHLIPTDKTPSSKESARLSTAFQKRPSRRILVVDDDPNPRPIGVDVLFGSKLESRGDAAPKIPMNGKQLECPLSISTISRHRCYER